MLKLYGFSVSNYYNMIKLALLEKQVPFEEVKVYPNQSDDYLPISPMGKVPCLVTDQGALTESGVILDYIEETQQGKSFYPQDAFAKAKVRELMRELELYIELPARRCYPEVFFGGKVSRETQEQTEVALKQGVAALNRTTSFSPYIAGAEMTYADFYFIYSFGLASQVAMHLYHLDLTEQLPGSKELMALMSERPAVKKVAEDLLAGVEEFNALRRARSN